MSTAPGDTTQSPWEVHAIQLNAFPTEPTAQVEQRWLEELVGETPESVIKKNLREDKIETKTGEFKVTLQPPKINWMEMAPVALDQESLPDHMPSLGPYPEVRDRFLGLMTRWLPSCPRIWRLGFGVTLFRPAVDRVHSYQLLATYLPDVKIDPEGSFNFLYQINRDLPPLSGPTDVRVG